jgi:gamma-glutamylcyclotransferase (GGCT)/AIG2-like uncharacterized protein YtfP
MVDLGYFPGVIQSPESYTAIHGEVYEVTPDVLQELDFLEGHPDFYERRVVTLEDGTEAWVYLLPNEFLDRPTVDSGDWVKHMYGGEV